MSQHTASRAARRGLSAAAVVAVGAVGLFAGTSAAHAENIDATATGSLIIHKYETPGNGNQSPDGEGTNPSSQPIDDVVFEYCSVTGVNILDGTNAGWDRLRAITSEELISARTGTDLSDLALTNCTRLDPTVDGETRSGRLALGAYLVREVEAPAHVTKLSEPFIVTIPTPGINTGAGDGTWVYDVNLYPKNDVGDKPVKTIQDQPNNGYVLGSEISYSVSQRVPAVAGDTYTKFVVTDTLDPRLEGTVAPVVTLNDVKLVEGTDYTTEWTTAGSPAQSTLTVKLTDALASLKVGDTVKVDFVATLKSLGNGEIVNQAVVNVNDLDLDGDTEPGTPTNQVWTRWGEVLLKKTNAADASEGLQGAEFRVWMSTKESGCKLDSDLVKVTKADGSDYTVSSGDDGLINIPGLWIGDDELNDGTMKNGLSERCYVLEEIKAPNGFVLPAGADAKHEVIVRAGEVSTVPVGGEIPNTQQTVPTLPLTGAAGQVMMVAGGLALVAIAAGSVLVARRRQQSEASQL